MATFSNTKAKFNRVKQNAIKAAEKIDDKYEKIKKYRREASRMASVANKRIDRLVKNELTDSPAYKKYIENGEPRFGIKGKSYNEVQAMVARMERFLDAKTSTVKGINKWVADRIDLTGLKYDNLKQLQKDSNKIFILFNKTEEYLRHVDDIGSAFDSDQIMDTVKVYVQTGKIDLNDTETALDEMIRKITDALKEYEQPVHTPNGWYVLKNEE